ncbi:DNA repair protein RadA [Aquibaculum arenosum]|uniref:DNA repair protein RadA n=1 Tax=Aquibaculum arenosum TaxID=3032591 RepID=A0ABT5YID5_9PROT|nr:DNA repair protein RadA [Fodinicurvata sp. CAU 1616]MDF2094570.1 DNA repair protein RadA [Fodinicurvata sp. CAU 1616]
MARARSTYVCQSCGAVSGRWAGRCEACGAWNSIVEEAAPEGTPGGLAKGPKRSGRKVEFVDLEGESKPAPRLVSGIGEFDRVCGGGLVPGSAVLVGGDPGIGKSTLLLQAAAALAAGNEAIYVSGEEAVEQVRLRAARLGLSKAPVRLAAATSVRDLVASLDRPDAPRLVIIDSIQTMHVDALESAPGTVAQVRASAQELVRVAKRRGFCLLLVGHVTKDGMIAGPKVLEHMVDCVLTFEGERGHQFRILRATKNRFGPTDEIGVFEMTDGGLMEVANPSELFLAERRGNIAGAAVFAGLEGTRPLLVEVQALVSPSPLGTPRRTVVGWDSGRLAMVLAVLEARCGLVMAGKDVYLNIAGGLRIGEPAADLAVAAALVSSACDRPVPEECVVFGEIGLSGEIRAVSQSEVRLKEAAKLGFASALLPPRRGRRLSPPEGIRLEEMSHLQDLVARIAAGGGADKA